MTFTSSCGRFHSRALHIIPIFFDRSKLHDSPKLWWTPLASIPWTNTALKMSILPTASSCPIYKRWRCVQQGRVNDITMSQIDTAYGSLIYYNNMNASAEPEARTQTGCRNFPPERHIIFCNKTIQCAHAQQKFIRMSVY